MIRFLLGFKLTKKIQACLVILASYFTIVGTVSFSAFICEEACQVITFANFSVKQSSRYDLLEENLQTITKINNILDMLVTYFLWLNPFAYTSYGLYVEATEAYVKTMRAEGIAKAPSLYVGKHVELCLRWTCIKTLPSGKFKVTAGRYSFITTERPESLFVTVSGMLVQNGKRRFTIK